MKELQLKDLSLKQKIGMLLCANLVFGEEDVADALELIRNHSLGAVWIQPNMKNRAEIIRRVRETADYPIIIMCDSESGYEETKIPDVLSMAAAGARNEYAHSFGRAVASQHSLMGYNTICNPLLDMNSDNITCGSTMRTFGPDKHQVVRLAGELARGMHEGGCLTVAKHYPGKSGKPFDSHMRENVSDYTEEELVQGNLYPYIELNKLGLLDGVMSGHNRLAKIDPEHPSSLSRLSLDIFRRYGFAGFYITDALCMMGVVLKYGVNDPHGMCVRAGNSLALSWQIPCRQGYDALMEGYEKGLFTDADMDEAIGYTLEAQHKTTLLPTPEKILEEDLINIDHINKECISAYCDEGVEPSISEDGKHLFVITTDKYLQLEGGKEYTPGPREWYLPRKIQEEIRTLFPNSEAMLYPIYPSYNENMPLYMKQAEFEDVIFITYTVTEAFVGREHLSMHVVDMMDALQSTKRVSAHLHFGNPFCATDAPHVPRVLIGLASADCISQTLKVLAGKAQAVGKLPYDLQFHPEGYLFY